MRLGILYTFDIIQMKFIQKARKHIPNHPLWIILYHDFTRYSLPFILNAETLRFQRPNPRVSEYQHHELITGLVLSCAASDQADHKNKINDGTAANRKQPPAQLNLTHDDACGCHAVTGGNWRHGTGFFARGVPGKNCNNTCDDRKIM